MTPDRDAGQDGTVQLQIHQVVANDASQLTATVRCLRGPVYLHAHFRRINQATTIHSELTSIDVYGRRAGQLDPVWTGQVTLTGHGVDLIRTGDIIDGDNPEDTDLQETIHNS
jgi:hypothetical protein